MFEVSDDPDRPYNTLVVVDRDGLRASYRKIHLYDSFGYKESDRLRGRPVEPVLVDVGGFRVGLMTCYDLRFPELARELVAARRRAARRPRGLGGRSAEGGPLAHAGDRPGHREHGVRRRGRPARPALHRPLAGRGPAGEVVAEVGDGDRVLTASIDRDTLEQARATNPSLANRRF